MWTEKKFPIRLESTDNIVIQTLQKFPGVVFSGGWVRDKLLGYPNTDIDLVAPYENFKELMLTFGRVFNEKARKNGFQVVNHQKRIRKGLPFTPCHFCLILKLSTGTKSQKRNFNLKIDIKQLHKSKGLEDEWTLRDFSVNCLFYDASTKLFSGYSESFKDIEDQILQPCFDLRKRIDLIRLLRAIRVSNSKELTLSDGLRDGMLKGQNVLNFQGLGRRLTSHTKERSPREYMKMLGDSLYRTDHFTDLYYYGYIFEWPFYLDSEVSGVFRTLLNRHFNTYLSVVRKWKGWRLLNSLNSTYEEHLLPIGLLMAVAIVSTRYSIKNFYCEGFFRVEEVLEAFFPSREKWDLSHVFDLLEAEKTENDPMFKKVCQFSNIFFSQGFKPVSMDYEEDGWDEEHSDRSHVDREN